MAYGYLFQTVVEVINDYHKVYEEMRDGWIPVKITARTWKVFHGLLSVSISFIFQILLSWE